MTVSPRFGIGPVLILHMGSGGWVRPGGPRQVGRRVRGAPGTPERRDAVVIRTKEAGGGWCGTLGWVDEGGGDLFVTFVSQSGSHREVNCKSGSP